MAGHGPHDHVPNRPSDPTERRANHPHRVGHLAVLDVVLFQMGVKFRSRSQTHMPAATGPASLAATGTTLAPAHDSARTRGDLTWLSEETDTPGR